jgi:Dynamin family
METLLMIESSLQKRVEQFFLKATAKLSQYPSLRGLLREFQRYQEQLSQPMRVAVVGRIKAGKSTAMNALLGEALVATGTVEATFNINWLKYGSKPALIIHYKDSNHPPEPKSPQQLAALTLRSEDPETLNFLLSIKYIEVFHPNSILQSLDLIDTPGLASSYEADSENTQEFLKLHGEELARETETQVSDADAILYLFSHSSLSESDQKIMELFQGPSIGRATPLNAIGVLTQADSYWPAREDPLSAAQDITQRLFTDHPRLHSLFYKIQPIAGLLALGAQTLTERDFSILLRLTTLPEQGSDSLETLMRSAKRFCEKEFSERPDIPSSDERSEVFKRLDLYGIHLACNYIRSGIDNQEQLSKLLLQHSGVSELRNLILSHFGDRAYLIKFNRYLQLIKRAISQQKQKYSDDELKKIINEIEEWLEKLECDELFFYELRELQVLRSLYEQTKLDFNEDEILQLLSVLGERGKSCGERLGLRKDASILEMQKQVQTSLEYWRYRSSDQLGGTPETVRAASVLAQSYERLAYHIEEASKHLNLQAEQNFEQEALTQQLQNCSNISEFASFNMQWQNLSQLRSQSDQFLHSYNDFLQQIKKTCFQTQQRYKKTELELIQKLAACVEKIEANNSNLQELKLFQSYESGNLLLNSEEIQHLFALIGKNGSSCSARLELPESATLPEMLKQVVERINYWQTQVNDPFRYDSQMRWAVNVFVHGYERIFYFLDMARHHLELK